MKSPDLDSATWRKSRWSNGKGAACVEVAEVAGACAVRDSKNPRQGALILSPAQWFAFTTGVRTGQFD